jgi:hypothetical protein
MPLVGSILRCVYDNRGHLNQPYLFSKKEKDHEH